MYEQIKAQFIKNDDFFQQEEIIGDSPLLFCGLNSMIDLPRTIADLKISDRGSKIYGLHEEKKTSPESVVNSILSGKLAIFDIHKTQCLIIEPIPRQLNRSVLSSTNENVVQGTLAAFIEDLTSNVGIVREQLRSTHLRVKINEIGSTKKTKLAVLYLEGSADNRLVQRIEQQILSGSSIDISSIQEVAKLLGFHKWSLIPQFKTTELSDEAANVLEQGRVVLFVDRMPFALSLPNYWWDTFLLGNDRQLPRPIMFAVRALRIFGVFVSITLPSLYVALVAVNPEVLRIQLALSVALSREGVPYPAILETLIMLLLLELILEASIRLPQSVGPTITMVGGIILGQAVVSAKLVSNLLIIIVAATTIANSTLVGIQNSYLVRSLKYITLILAAIFGVMGIFIGVVMICGILASEHTYGISYIRLPFTKDEVEHD